MSDLPRAFHSTLNHSGRRYWGTSEFCILLWWNAWIFLVSLYGFHNQKIIRCLKWSSVLGSAMGSYTQHGWVQQILFFHQAWYPCSFQPWCDASRRLWEYEGKEGQNGAGGSFQICDISLDWFWFQGTQNLLYIPRRGSCWWCANSWTNRLVTPLVCSPISTNLRSGEKSTFCVFTHISYTDKPYSMEHIPSQVAGLCSFFWTSHSSFVWGHPSIHLGIL